MAYSASCQPSRQTGTVHTFRKLGLRKRVLLSAYKLPRYKCPGPVFLPCPSRGPRERAGSFPVRFAQGGRDEEFLPTPGLVHSHLLTVRYSLAGPPSVG